MGASQRNKGKAAEVEVYHWLNETVATVVGHGKWFQRNQNQTASSGSDLSNPFRLSVEIKRHETLSINQWWAQCVKSAKMEHGIPVLIYRQSRQPWRAVIEMIDCYGGIYTVTMSADNFETWLRNYVARWVGSREDTIQKTPLS
jgi:hypothetical protein